MFEDQTKPFINDEFVIRWHGGANGERLSPAFHRTRRHLHSTDDNENALPIYDSGGVLTKNGAPTAHLCSSLPTPQVLGEGPSHENHNDPSAVRGDEEEKGSNLKEKQWRVFSVGAAVCSYMVHPYLRTFNDQTHPPSNFACFPTPLSLSLIHRRRRMLPANFGRVSFHSFHSYIIINKLY